MSKTYEIPPWSANPNDDFFLEVLKDGSIIENIDLSEKSHYIFGRQPDLCNVTLDHPSISRMHSVLQFRDDGALMIVDLNSQHGTMVNKKTILPNVYQRVYVGDIIQFGASTRKYLLNGPNSQRLEEYDSANLRNYRNQLVKQSATIAEMNKQNEDTGISWGFREDAEDEPEDEDEETDQKQLPEYLLKIRKDENYDRKFGEKYSCDLQESEVNEKDQAIIDKIRVKERKVQNMQEEISRIYKKEGTQDEGLTEGQIAAVERNDKRIEVLKDQIEQLVVQIRIKNASRNGVVYDPTGISSSLSKGSKHASNVSSEKHKDKAKHEQDEGVGGDVLDTTGENVDVSTNWRLKKKLNSKQNSSKASVNSATSNVWNTLRDDLKDVTSVTYEELCALEEKQLVLLQNITMEIMKLQEHISHLEGKCDAIKARRDVVVSDGGGMHEELDEYLIVTSKQEAAESLAKWQMNEERVTDKLVNIQKLIKIAAPAILPSTSTQRDRVVGMAIISASQAPHPPGVNSHQPTAQDSIASKYVTPSFKALEVKHNEEEVMEVVADQDFRGPLLDEKSISAVADTSERKDISKGVVGKKRSAEPSATYTHALESLLRKVQSDSHHEKGVEEGVEGDLAMSVSVSANGRSSGEEGNENFPRQENQADSLQQTAKRARAAVLGPMRGPAGAEAASVPSATRSRTGTGTGGGTGPSLTPSSTFGEGEGDVEWVPPKNQTGDGKTALNAKYGY